MSHSERGGGSFAATAISVILVLALVLSIAAIALWHSGLLLSRVPILGAGGQRVDAAIYSVCYGDILHSLEGEEYADPHAEAIARTDKLLSHALIFLSLAEAEGKLDGYEHQALLAGERAVEALRAAAAEVGRTEKEYIADRYGRGIREGDVLRAAALLAAASFREAELRGKLYTAEEREAAFEANRDSLLLADCIVYSVKVKLSENATPDEMREAYLAAEARAQKIASATGKTTFLAEMQADYRRENPSADYNEVSEMTQNAYRYCISANENDMVARWVRESGRTAGDMAVLGANGDYQVVYCLSAAEKREQKTSDVYLIRFPFTDAESRNDAYAAAVGPLNSYRGPADFIAHGENGGEVEYFENAWRPELPRKLADWLDLSYPAGTVYLIEVEDAFLLICYEGEGELAVWEKQAALILQEEELAALSEGTPIRDFSLGRLFLLL